MGTDRDLQTWERLSELLERSAQAEVESFLAQLPLNETVRTVSRLDEADQARLLQLLSPQEAAGLVESLPREPSGRDRGAHAAGRGGPHRRGAAQR